MAYVQGKEVLLKIPVSGTPTALTGEITCTLTKEVQMDQIATKTAGAWAAASPGQKSWTLSGEGVIDEAGDPALAALETAFDADTLVEDVQMVEPAPLKTYTGDGYVSSFTKTAGADGGYRVTFTITGTGALTSATTT